MIGRTQLSSDAPPAGVRGSFQLNCLLIDCRRSPTARIEVRTMARSYLGAKRIATRDGFDVVYHDFDKKVYGACPRGQPQGHFKNGTFVEHVCLYFPASMSSEDMEWKEDCKFRDDPYWQENFVG